MEETEDSESVMSVMVISHIWTQGLFHIGRPGNWVAVSTVLIQFIMSFILSSVCSSHQSFVRLFLRSHSRSFVFCQVLCLSFLIGSPAIPRWWVPVCDCRAFLKNSSSFISIDGFFHDLLSTNSVFFSPPISRRSAWWSFSCKNKLILF